LKVISDPETASPTVGADSEYCPVRIQSAGFSKIQNLRSERCAWINPQPTRVDYGEVRTCCIPTTINYGNVSHSENRAVTSNINDYFPCEVKTIKNAEAVSESDHSFNFVLRKDKN
jgi:hypothetical protein